MTARRSATIRWPARAAALLLLLGAGCGPQRYDPASARDQRVAMEERVADVLAAEVEPLVRGPARVAVIHAAPDTNFGEEHARILAALQAELKRQDPPVVAWPLGPAPSAVAGGPGYAPPPAPLTGAWLAAQLKAHPDVGAIVSLVDAPAEEPARLPPELPPLVCLAPLDGHNVGPLMRAGLIKAAIVPRRSPTSAKEADWFDVRFEVVRPDTVATWENLRRGAPP